MKKIEAIVRKIKFDDVIQALHEVDIDFFTYWSVRGVGTSRQGRVYRGVVYDTSAIERIMLSFVVRNHLVKPAIDAISKAAYTGEVGDGKIFISPIEESIRIRTGEYGDVSLYVKEEDKIKKF